MIATITLPICCMCKQVSEEEVGPPAQVDWTPLEIYLYRHHLGQDDVRLTHTYCPSCFEIQARAWRVPSAISSS